MTTLTHLQCGIAIDKYIAGFQPISVDQELGRNFRFWAAGMSASMTRVARSRH